MNANDNTDLHSSGRTCLVHKTDQEGAIVIDALTGHVISGQHDKPEWAEGLLLANFTERHSFYTTRLGPDLYTAEMRSPTAFAADDLGWVAWDQEQREVEVEPSAEFRSEVIREVLRTQGIIKTDPATGEDSFVDGSIVRGIMLDPDNRRSEEEISALAATQADTFGAVEGVKTGTHG